MPTPDEFLARAWQAYHAGDRPQAERLCWELLRLQPLHADAIYLLGVLGLETGQPARALLHFHHLTLLRPDAATYHNALGETYRTRGELDRAEACFRAAIRREPGFAAAHHALGLVLMDRGQSAEAEASFRQAIALKPDHERAHLNLGRVLQGRGEAEAAGACFAEALRLRPDYPIAHNNLGAVRQSQGRHEEAIGHLREALRLQPNYPEAHFNLGNSLQALGDPGAARGHFQEAIRLRPDYYRAYHSLGRALEALGELPAAVNLYREAVRLRPDYAEAYENLGNLFLLQPDWEGARAAFEKGLELRPDNAEAFARLVYTRQVLCDWRNWDADMARLERDARQELAEGKATSVIPFCALTLDWSAQRQLAVVRSHAAAVARNVEPLRRSLNLSHPAPAPAERLRVGYLSCEFRDHAVSHLTIGVFGRHDRRAVEVFAYSFGPNDRSSYRRRVERDVDHFRDLAGASLADSARRIHEDNLHLLIDLQGFTGFSKMSLLALHPAPVQVNWLGYPGTLGADYIEYMIGDPSTTPSERAEDIHERLVLLPHTYLATDNGQPVSASYSSRAESGLPERGAVFCGFSNRYKLEPRIFDAWMRILARVPGSVLWLSPGPPVAVENLRREAEARGVAGSRLVFATHAPDKADHLARHRLADLFLDTLYYNAHTTAVDALWAGLPVLTLPGGTFAARVGGGVLRALGLPELIASDLKEYEERAVHLARHPDELAAIRRKLEAQQTTWPLFDTARLVRNLEKAYRAIWEDHVSGRGARLIRVED